MFALKIGKNNMCSSSVDNGTKVEIKSVTLSSSDFVLEDGLYCATVLHNLNNLNPLMNVFNSSGNVEYSITDATINDFKIWLLEADTITLTFLVTE